MPPVTVTVHPAVLVTQYVFDMMVDMVMVVVRGMGWGGGSCVLAAGGLVQPGKLQVHPVDVALAPE